MVGEQLEVLEARKERIGIYLGVLLAVVLGYTVVYNLAMAHLEGQPQSIAHSLGVVVQSLTTTGYGQDAGTWNNPWTQLLAVAMQFSGVLLIFAALPLFVVPLIQDALRSEPPRRVEGMTDHVLICGYSGHEESLIDELGTRDIPFVVVRDDPAAVQDLRRMDVTAMLGDPEDPATLRAAAVADARAAVVDVGDERGASVVLALRSIDADLEIVSLVEDADTTAYHRYAGADTVITPEEVLGRSLADKVTTSVTTRLSGSDDLDESLELAELSLGAGCDLAGVTIADSGIRERTGANLVGVWDEGTFRSPPPPDLELTERSVLLASGRQEEIAALTDLTQSPVKQPGRGHVVVLGHGMVGRTVTDVLAGMDVPSTAVDLEDRPAVDVVGDSTQKWTVEQAGVTESSSVVVALGTDTEAIYATLVVRELDPDVEVLVRANDDDNVEKLYRAGADYVLSLPAISGRMIAAAVLDDDVLSLTTQVDVVRTPVPALVGRTLADADLQAATGCTVVALQRDGRLVTDLSPELEIQEGDELVVAGPDHDVNEFAARVRGGE